MVIYKITNQLNGKPYIGQTRQPLEKRFLQHSKANSPLGQAMRDCGIENFTIEVIEKCATPKQTREREMFWIRALKSKIPNGYNQTNGGERCAKNVYEMLIGSSLKRFRKAFNLTQDNVAEAIGISRPLYTKYECDKNMPSVDTVMKIAIAFGVPLDYLVGLSDEPNPIKLDEKTLAVVRAMQENFQPRQTVTA